MVCIDDIKDDVINKSILYGAKNNKEFQEKLKIYEKMKAKMLSKSKLTNASVNKMTRLKEDRSRDDVCCFNCGVLGQVVGLQF